MAAPRQLNRRTALTLGGVSAAMVGASFAAVPLYRLFCQVTGFGGTTQRAAAAPGADGTRRIVVRFDASIAGNGPPWTFAPVERQVTVALGEERIAFYRATSQARIATAGTATFNVTPHKAGAYFNKIACFCFSDQTLAPGESLDMPVSFFIDPAIAGDPNLADVDAITLSYTFFRAADGTAAQRNAATPSGGRAAN